MVTPQGHYTNIVYRHHMLVVSVWLCIAIFIFAWHLYKHLNFRKWILSAVYEPKRPELERIVERYREKLHIYQKVKIYVEDAPISPFTIGILRPIIIVPKNLDLENIELIIHHELCHIQRNDIVIKFLRMIVVGIYWFNPLVYLLDSYLEEYCEFACDELVTKDLDKESKRRYGYLIIDMASLNISGPAAYITPFSNDKNNIKKRMELIMRNEKRTNKLALCLSVGMILCSSFTAFAYEGPRSIIFTEHPTEDVFLENADQTVRFINGHGTIQSLIYDSQFIDKNGNIYRIDEEQDSRKKCTHTYADGEYEKHTKNKDKSCVTKVYNAQRCTKCGGIKIGSLIRTVKNSLCNY